MRILRRLGHRVTIETEYRGAACDLLVALHARRSFASIERFHRDHPERPLILALTGTDLYGDLRTGGDARRALDLASHLILLQPAGLGELPARIRGKARVVYQSASPAPGRTAPSRRAFDVCVIGHLRPVKDPFRAAEAARLLPVQSRVRIVHIGAALSPNMRRAARAEAARNPRYRWLGDLPRWKALRVLAHSRLMVLSSLAEGGANVVSEAIVAGVPVLASRIPGSIGILGPDYPGYFRPGDTRGLRDGLWRAETDPVFYGTLKRWCGRLASTFDPAREREAWKRLLRDARGGRPRSAAARTPVPAAAGA
jgi:putative glycosyltransferase (TIGR04348 family)